MSDFKVGDRVRVKKSEQAFAERWGLTGELVINALGEHTVRFVGREYCADEDRLEKIEEKKMPKIEMGKKYRTRSGLPARVLATDLAGLHPVAAVITCDPSIDAIWRYSATGRVGISDNQNDLIEVKPEQTKWVIAGPDYGFDSLKAAKTMQKLYPRPGDAIVKITFTEGEGLEDAES